jgi:hypothetical protein
MIRKTVLAGIAGLLLVSCASVDARQPATIDPIEGFTVMGNDFSPMTGESSSAPISRQHRGPVTALASVSGTSTFFSAGKDGFLTRHTDSGDDDSWQVSDIAIKRIAVNGDGNLVAIYETDGFTVNRISVWDWNAKSRVYAKRFKDSVVSLFWSARGTYLMVGNTSLEGLTVLEGKTGNPVTLFAQSPGIVTSGVTGKSETSMVTFGSSGRILYTDMASGAERASYEGPQDLEFPVFIDNNTKIAGYQYGAVILVDATSGKTVSSWESSVPVMATFNMDTLPVWLERTADLSWILRKGNTASSPFTVGESTEITAAISLGTEIVFGTDAGKLYRLSLAAAMATDSTVVPSLIPNREIQVIDDIIADGERLFLLSKGSLFISSGPGKSPVFAFSGIEGNRMSMTGTTILFWSADKAAPLVLSSIDGTVRKTLYQGAEGIHSLSISGNTLAFVEGNSKAVVIDFANDTPVFSYSGAGLQDAVVTTGNRMVISRSSTKRAPNPVIIINTETGETVPLLLDGELCFALKPVSADGKDMAAFFVKTDSSTRTELVAFSLEPNSLQPTNIKTVASYADEDLVATLFYSAGRIYTNLGKASLVGISVEGAQAIRFQRGYSIPLKATVMDRFVVSLNQDGSLTWFDRDSASLLSCSAITTDGYWLEQ